MDRKSQKFSSFFDEWLSLMDHAWSVLTPEAFKSLEDKIIAEIEYHRKDK